MSALPPEESPRIAKITTSTLQFRQLINSLRNNQIKSRQQQEESASAVENLPNNNQQQPLQASSPSNHIAPSRNLFDIGEDDEDGLRSVPKTEVGGRDQLKKHKALFDAKPEFHSQPSRVIEVRKQAAVQFEESKSKQISFSFQSPRKSVSIQCEPEHHSFTTPIESSFLMQASKTNQKAGQIVRQQVKQQAPVQSEQPSKRIRDIHQNLVIDYCRKQRLVEKSQPSQIFSFFTNLCLSCDVIIRSPSIKKFKNCIYYGHAIAKDEPYEGFLYFYDSRVYYGQFLNGLKHGLGVELAYNDEIKYKGEFNDGRKTGKFYVEKPTEKYIGYLENGLYQGEGRLTTPDYVYQGLFQQGQKNGYGQEFYPKTGVKISGMFKNGVLEKTRASKSIAELRDKSKNRDKQRLQVVRKKSLEKHSARMNKVRSFRESEYEIDFQPQTDYNELPRLHFNASKLDVYRQPIQKLPKITHESHGPIDPPSRLDSLVARTPQAHFRKKPREMSGRVLGINPQRQSSSQNEQPLPTPYLSYPRRQE